MELNNRRMQSGITSDAMQSISLKAAIAPLYEIIRTTSQSKIKIKYAKLSKKE